MGGTNGRTDERTDKRKSPCVLQDFVPFGAAAQKVKDSAEHYVMSYRMDRISI